MTLKGNYSALTSYSVGDVVLYTDGVVYFLRETTPAGTPCTDTRYWQKLNQELAEAVKLVLDGMAIEHVTVANNLTTSASGKVLDARQGKALKEMITPLQARVSEKVLTLGSSTEASTKVFAITVTDDGTIAATEVVVSE